MYSGLKKLGAQAKLYSNVFSPDSKKIVGKIDNYFSPYGEISVDDNAGLIQMNLLGPNKEATDKVKNGLSQLFPNFDFEVHHENKAADWNGKPTGHFIFMTIKAKEGAGGKPMATESLNEHYVAGGIVGIQAINTIPPREKESYETAFEYFLSERYEKEEVKDEEVNEEEINEEENNTEEN